MSAVVEILQLSSCKIFADILEVSLAEKGPETWAVFMTGQTH